MTPRESIQLVASLIPTFPAKHQQEEWFDFRLEGPANVVNIQLSRGWSKPGFQTGFLWAVQRQSVKLLVDQQGAFASRGSCR